MQNTTEIDNYSTLSERVVPILMIKQKWMLSARERNLYWNESQKGTTCLVISKIGNCQQSIQ